MADITKLKQALNAYTGDNDTLNQFSAVATSELGEEWIQTIFDVMTDLTTEERERLDYLYRHYAAVAAWNEAQSYLAQETPLDRAIVEDRIAVLDHWLTFYQDAGHQVVEQLKQKLAQQVDAPLSESATATGAVAEPSQTTISSAASEAQPVGQPTAQPTEQPVQPAAQATTSPEQSKTLWALEKIRKEVDITKELQAWVAARCVSLGNKEVMSYPYYGLVIDVMRQTRKQIQTIFDSEEMLEEIERVYPDEIKSLQDYQLLLDKDIEVATQNGLDQDLDLLGGLSIEEIKRVLGQMDTSNTKEESEPPPDGFVPILDSDSDLDEQPIKEEYSQIENVVLSENSSAVKTDVIKNKDENEKNTSQTPENGVKKKLSFSLGNKKPSAS